MTTRFMTHDTTEYYGAGGLSTGFSNMAEDGFQIKDRVRIIKTVTTPGGGHKTIKVVEDGVVIDRRFGHRGLWIRVFCPVEVEERLINFDPRNAEWFCTNGRHMQVIRIGGAQ